MRVQVTFDTEVVSRIRNVEAAVAFVYSDDEPLRGVAVRSDWRLNGFLSRLVRDERFVGELGEWLLVSTQGRLPYSHLFLVGAGDRNAPQPARMRRLLAGVAHKVALAGLHSVAVDLSELADAGLDAEAAMDLFLQEVVTAYPDDEMADPPYQPALEVQERNARAQAMFRRRRKEMQRALDAWIAEHGSPDGTREELERPVAGELEASSATPVPEPPPGPETLGEPPLEPPPERLVRVVVLSPPGQGRGLRSALRQRDGTTLGGARVECR